MRVLMLGWEYPPYISGGLGTACEGLTTALARHNVEVVFVVPHLFGGENANHMTLLNSWGHSQKQLEGHGKVKKVAQSRRRKSPASLISRRFIPAMLKPYFTPESFKAYAASLSLSEAQRAVREIVSSSASEDHVSESIASGEKPRVRVEQYGWNIYAEVGRFASNVASSLSRERFDIIHCHDWMTYPAGVALAQITKKPLVVHVHSLEYDRSGLNVNQQIHHIERFGLQAARRVIAVSYYTRRIIHEQHGIPLDKICVVHNGVYSSEAMFKYRKGKNWPAKIVLFLGRITFQKGPDYFIEAAAKVIPHIPDVLFVMAGSGDMLQRCIDRVNQLGLGQHFQFPGFLRGPEVEEMFSIADLYVMPSVSEPFGISALEAIKFDTPVIISRQSGVAEVLTHALKVDFWDIDRMADLMINSLLHEELRSDMVAMAREEVRRLHWDAAALKTREIYSSLL